MATIEWREANKEKMREYRRKHYHENKEPYLERAKNNKTIAREYVRSIKDQLFCSQCKENHPAVLDFHHPDPLQKEFSISRAISTGQSIKKIQSEISKCIILCSNCHRKLHYDERNSS